MPLRKPTADDLRKAGESFGLNPGPEELAAYEALSEGVIGFFERLDQIEEPRPAVKYPRGEGYRPSAEEDPLNAWYWKCSIKGKFSGKLAGKRVAVKDNVCVAGIPMMNGSALLEGYVPEMDATVVTRVLDNSQSVDK